MREMRVVTVGIDRVRAQSVLLLEEVGGQHRLLQVWIGPFEAAVIEGERRAERSARPLTHQLISAVASALGGRLRQVDLVGLEAGVYLAELVLEGDRQVPARPSDAVALALHDGVPIYAGEGLLDQVGMTAQRTAEGDEAQLLDRFRRFLDSAAPADFDRE